MAGLFSLRVIHMSLLYCFMLFANVSYSADVGNGTVVEKLNDVVAYMNYGFNAVESILNGQCHMADSDRKVVAILRYNVSQLVSSMVNEHRVIEGLKGDIYKLKELHNRTHDALLQTLDLVRQLNASLQSLIQHHVTTVATTINTPDPTNTTLAIPLSTTTDGSGLNCNLEINLTSPTILISPGYPDNYPNNVRCTYNVTSAPDTIITMQFETLDLETSSGCPYDYIEVFDASDEINKIARLCSTNNTIRSSSNALYLIFKSDQSVRRKGFNATLRAKWFKAISVWKNRTILNSPNYPHNYSNNLDREYSIKATEGNVLIIKIIDFSLQKSNHCISDYLEIFDASNKMYSIGRYCGNMTLPKTISSSINVLYLRLKTDAAITARGFSISIFKMCPDNWRFHSGRCFYFASCYHTCSINYINQTCYMYGAYPARALTQADQLFFAKRVRNPYFILGGNDKVTENRWLWPDGTLINSGFTNWATGEPKQGTIYNCMNVETASGLWYSYHCTHKYYWSYICEQPQSVA